MRNLVERLEKKGWEGKDIAKAVGIIRDAKAKKPGHIAFLHKRVYWILFAVIIAANFAVSIALLPLLVALNGIFLYLVLAVLGIVLGFLFELVIRSIEHLEKRHHIFLAMVIPLTALANVFAMTNVSNDLAKTLNLVNFNNSVAVALVYSISFVLPYGIYRFVLKIEYYAKE